MKAYSKEALSQKQVQRRKKIKIIPETPEKKAAKEELEGYIETLSEMLDSIEIKLNEAREARKPDNELISTLEDRRKKHNEFQENLTTLKDHLEDDEIKHDDIADAKEGIEYYIDSSMEPDFMDDAEMFEELFQKAEAAKEAMVDEYEDEDENEDDEDGDDDNDDDDDDSTPQPSPKKATPAKAAPVETKKAVTPAQPLPVKVEPIKSQPQAIPARKTSDASPLSSPVKKQSLPETKQPVIAPKQQQQQPAQTTTTLKPPLVPPTKPAQSVPVATTTLLINDPKQTKAKQATPNLKVKVPPTDSNTNNTTTPKSAPIQPNAKSVPQPNTPLTAVTEIKKNPNGQPGTQPAQVPQQIQQQLTQLNTLNPSPPLVNPPLVQSTNNVQKISPSPTIKQPLNQPNSNVVKSHVSYIDMAKAQQQQQQQQNVQKKDVPIHNNNNNNTFKNQMFDEVPTTSNNVINHDITILSNNDNSRGGSQNNNNINPNIDAEHSTMQNMHLGMEDFSFNNGQSSSSSSSSSSVHVHTQGVIAPPSSAPQPLHPAATLFTPSDADWTNSMLEASLSALPGGTDCERPRVYVPLNECVVPDCFPQQPVPILGSPNLYANMDVDTLFFIFYFKQGTYQQYLAAKELKRQAWRYHRKYMTWFQRHDKPRHTTNEYEHGTYRYFDYETGWCQRIKSGFRFEYQHLEDELPVQ